MKNLIIISILGLSVAGCHDTGVDMSKIHYVCNTPFGVGQFDDSDSKVIVAPGYITADKDSFTVKIPRSMCVEIVEKESF